MTSESPLHIRRDCRVSLFQLFDSSEFVFDVPPYQRPYAWRTKQIYELLQDFVRAYESRQEYFLGAIVATRAASGGAAGGATDGAHTPYQLIDGQQRLTSLMLLLGYLRHWASSATAAPSATAGSAIAASGPGPGLEGRLRRMLYLEADPLDPGSTGRYRLQLREPDNAFLRAHMLDGWLPTRFRRAGIMAAGAGGSGSAADAGGEESAGTGAGDGWGISSIAGEVAEGAAGEVQPLASESHWRLYENATFLSSQLDRLAAAGLNLQDFAFHVLRNCFVVLMVARDENASFTIFSCLNGRGMDLTVVDKLKAELLQSLSPAERASYAAAWSDMEAVLGRPAFHRVFTYMRRLAAVRDPGLLSAAAVGGLAVGGSYGSYGDARDGEGGMDADGAAAGVLEYFTRRADDPAAVKQVALDYARLLLQLRQASWVPPPLPPSQSLQREERTAGSAAAGPQDAAAQQQAALLAELNARSAALNLFADEAWLPPLLEFCYQTDDLAQRVQFMKAAEALQLLLELQGDAAAKAARWGVVAEALLSRPFSPRAVLQAVALSNLERAAFRCEPPSVWAQVPDIRGLHVEKVVPQSAPEGSTWRKTRLSTPCDPQSAWPPVWFDSGSGSSSGSSCNTSPGASISRSTRDLNSSAASEPAADVASSFTSSAAAATAAAAASAAASSSYEVKYWYDVQRLHWHGKLGNLVLLPATAATASAAAAATASTAPSPPSSSKSSASPLTQSAAAPLAASAALAPAPAAATTATTSSSGSSLHQQHHQHHHPNDYDAKAAQWRAAGAGARLPGFTGPLLQPGAGRYSRFRFCYDECRQRHQEEVWNPGEPRKAMPDWLADWGVVLKGIKVVDAESKQKVRKELAKAARVKARSRMDVDDGAAAAAAGSGRAGAKKRSARVVVPKAKAGKAGAGSSKAAAGDEMQE
eukprot:XP_001691234.1 predicted protein [Chlamydomonas reinhardtii]